MDTATLVGIVAALAGSVFGAAAAIYASRIGATTELTKSDRDLLDRREERITREQETLRQALVDELERQTSRYGAALADLQRQIDDNRVEEAELRNEIERLSNALTKLTLENQRLRGENLRLSQQVAALTEKLRQFGTRIGDGA